MPEEIGTKYSVMKSKDLKPRLIYLARFSFKIEGEIKSFPDKKIKGVHYHQNSSIRNVKRSSLRRRKKKIRGT